MLLLVWELVVMSIALCEPLHLHSHYRLVGSALAVDCCPTNKALVMNKLHGAGIEQVSNLQNTILMLISS